MILRRALIYNMLSLSIASMVGLIINGVLDRLERKMHTKSYS